MAMSILLRNGARCSVIPNVFKNQSLVTRLAGNYSPIQGLAKKETALLQRVKAMCGKPATKNMSLIAAPKHWSLERALSLCLYGMIPAAIIMPGNLILDNIAVFGMVLHSHWGLETIVVDYVRPLLFGNLIPKLALVGLTMWTIFALGSLIYFNMNDVGFGQAIRNVWYLQPCAKASEAAASGAAGGAGGAGGAGAAGGADHAKKDAPGKLTKNDEC